ncbi:MAG TPA: C45 family peptidase [Acidobacteriaceae bacterium]|nr:C45 family peptidase [Acidobacteriaceae bacterium]
MRFGRLGVAVLAVCGAVSGSQAAWTQSGKTPGELKDAYTFEQGGWTYVHLAGSPHEIGFQHGYLLKDEIDDNLSVYKLEATNDYHRDWSFFREAAKNVLWPHIELEYQAELHGIADGLKAHGSTADLWDVVALNADLELTQYYLPMVNAREKKANPEKAKAQGRCSAFIATGSATKDGKIVMAHSNWTSYAEGERWVMVFDIQPEHGLRMLMDGTPGVITSQDDFGVNSAGLMITETTLPMAAGFDEQGIPEFVRSRKAMQYATSIDEYAAIMRKGNNGGYANSWMIGDRKTNEIAYLELGLHHTPLTKKTDGYFVSANFTVDPLVIRDDTPGFNPKNMSSSMNARRVTGEAFVKKHTGRLDTALAEAYLSDHWDSFEKKEDPGKRSLCGHEETSAEGEPVWGNPPYSPSGAVTGEVTDATMAEQMSMIVRAGHPCGADFVVAPFLAAHPEFAWQQPILHDMKAGPWTEFRTGEPAPKGAGQAAEGR